jgi:hypothetical protein
MTSKIGKLAVAAAIAIAVLLGVHFWGTSSGVTWAQAIAPILSANTAILEIIVGEETEETPVIHDMVMGSRIRRTVSFLPGNVSIIDLETGRILNLSEDEKEAVYIDLKGLPSIPNYLDQLKNVVLMLQDSEDFVVEDLGTEEIDGREVVGFLAEHPKVEITLWADAQTGLPVRIEQNQGQLRVICKNVQFDLPMSEELFSMEVPEGYELQEVELVLLGATEEDFIEGLRILAETFNDGQFPDDVSLEAHVKRAGEMVEKFETLDLSEEEETELGGKLQKHVLFIRFFQGEGKWYYRGKGVKLGEAEVPIFWYRPKHSDTYRVIYGDLHVEDVAREDLPEPLDDDDVVGRSAGYKPGAESEFVGAQEDNWHIHAGGRIVVESRIVLEKGPEGVATMPVTLPYSAGVMTSVTLGDVEIPFAPAGDGTYELQLPVETLLAGRRTITCRWELSLADLPQRQAEMMSYHEVALNTLIPVSKYSLTAHLAPDSGLEFSKKPSETQLTLFTKGNRQPRRKMGTCGLTIRERR